MANLIVGLIELSLDVLAEQLDLTRTEIHRIKHCAYVQK